MKDQKYNNSYEVVSVNYDTESAVVIINGETRILPLFEGTTTESMYIVIDKGQLVYV